MRRRPTARAARASFRRRLARRRASPGVCERPFFFTPCSRVSGGILALAVVTGAVRQNGLALEFATPGEKDRKKITFHAVTTTGRALQHAPAHLKQDRDIVLAAVKQDHEALQYAATELRNDEKFLIQAIRQNPKVMAVVSDQLAQNPDFVLKAIRANSQVSRPSNGGNVPNALLYSRESLLALIDRKEWSTLQAALRALETGDRFTRPPQKRARSQSLTDAAASRDAP